MDFQPLPIRDAIDERAYDVLLALFRAWHARQKTTAPKRERARGAALITRLWKATRLAGPGPRPDVPKALILLVSAEMRELADRALEEYREELARSMRGEPPHIPPDGVNSARKAAKAAAMAVILERLAPLPRNDPKRDTSETRYYKDKRERREKELGAWSWVGRRADGLARDLTALELRINPGSLRVLKHRANQRKKIR